MHTRVSLAALVAIVLFSCSANDPTPVVNGSVPSHLVEGDYKRELIYDSENRIIQLTATIQFPNGTKMVSTQNFAYTEDGLISELSSDTGFKFVYQYDNALIIKTDEYVNGHLSQTHVFQYDIHQHVTEYTTYQDIPEESGIIPVARTTYSYDEKDNAIQTKLYYYSTGGINENLLTVFDYSDFDDKSNAQTMFDILVVNPNLILHHNNPGKLEIRNGNGVLASTNLYSYQYNESGYPTIKSTTTISNNQTDKQYARYFYK